MPRKLPEVSVIVPAFRQADFIAGALDCIQAQTYEGDVETIVVDDGCPEKSGQRAEEHALRPRVLYQQNLGVAAARNRGVESARGQLVAFLDADDRWSRKKLERQVSELLNLGEPGLSFTRFSTVTGEGNLTGTHPELDLEPSLSRLLRRNFIGCSTVIVHRKCVLDAKGFPDSPEFRRGGQDYALWLRIARHYPMVYVPECLTKYAIHSNNRVGSDAIKNFRGAVYALRDHASGATLTNRRWLSLILARASDMAADLLREGASLKRWRQAAQEALAAATRR